MRYQGMSHEEMWGQILGRVNSRQKGVEQGRNEIAMFEEQGQCGHSTSTGGEGSPRKIVRLLQAMVDAHFDYKWGGTEGSRSRWMTYSASCFKRSLPCSVGNRQRWATVQLGRPVRRPGDRRSGLDWHSGDADSEQGVEFWMDLWTALLSYNSHACNASVSRVHFSGFGICTLSDRDHDRF